MSANEVLEQVKALPPRERRKFFARVHELEMPSQALLNGKQKRRIRWPDAAARRRRIFGDKVLPNLVLLACELERYQDAAGVYNTDRINFWSSGGRAVSITGLSCGRVPF